MKVIIVCKRHYTNRDLIKEKYGRLFEIPEALSLAGHEVHGLAISYKKSNEGFSQPGLVKWKSVNSMPFIGIKKYISELAQLIKSIQPDVLWVSSDAWNVIVVAAIARKMNIPFVVDLYDNYESFTLSKIPLVKTVFRKSCAKASAITSVTKTLKNYIADQYIPQEVPIELIGNASNPNLFFKVDKAYSRKKLCLPTSAKIIGTAGHLAENRGISVLFESFLSMADKYTNLYLLVAGPRDTSIKKYTHPRIIDMGNISPQEINYVWNSLDLAIICNIDTAFGRYCYPQKYEEILACETPLLAADVGELSNILHNNKILLFNPNSADDLANKIERQLRSPITAKMTPKTWADAGKKLAFLLEKVVEAHHSRLTYQ